MDRLSLDGHWAYLQAAWQEAREAPLSLRRIVLAAALVDAFVDRLFDAGSGIGDRLGFRAEIAKRYPALDIVGELCSVAPDGPRLKHETTSVPIEDYQKLSVADFMVSLYNGHSVQRAMIIWPDGRHEDAQAVLAEAMAGLDALRQE